MHPADFYDLRAEGLIKNDMIGRVVIIREVKKNIYD